MSYNNVKSIYPQFKCLTAHRATMKKIKSADKTASKWVKKYIGEDYLDALEYYIYQVRKELLKDKRDWYVKSEKNKILNRNSKYRKTKVFEDIYTTNLRTERIMEVNYHTERLNLEPAKQLNLFYKYEEEQTKHIAKTIKKYPFLYKDGDIQDKEEAYADWVKHEMWMSAKKGAFYETMLERDRKGISLCDDVIGLINEYL